jgi:hypothetical protein
MVSLTQKNINHEENDHLPIARSSVHTQYWQKKGRFSKENDRYLKTTNFMKIKIT